MLWMKQGLLMILLFSLSSGLRIFICLKKNHLSVILHPFTFKQVAIILHWWCWIKEIHTRKVHTISKNLRWPFRQIIICKFIYGAYKESQYKSTHKHLSIIIYLSEFLKFVWKWQTIFWIETSAVCFAGK